ncbi:sensor histidine kinase [Gracilibacillus alcaliphilus]|uniref:sensor histidine kinase n=1 Tax=Gracilibacillus alcaliphilus TaxID=1401441 RepID=UPI00195B6F67|nr:HAMP domain-containing sensor histidine kinase [Gracilibacillus alcaliphilus]MBM7677812.1 signal transduction histidine kinase [Gracilibacillus alcaliphilus]
MKWKITLRYLLSILSIVFIVCIANTIILFGILYHQSLQGATAFDSNSGEDFTRAFQKYLGMNDGEPVVSKDGEEALSQFGAWLQILDQNGDVVASYQAPEDLPNHYTPIELVHRYKYMDDDLNTYFIGEYEEYSYLIVVPDSSEQRTVFMVNGEQIFTSITQFLGTIIIVDLLIATLVGFLFSTILTKPINRLINRIHALKERIFEKEKPKRPGIYKHVFDNINEVAEKLQAYEQERQKLEKMRNEWISNVSHDIKTPLSSIRGYAELLRSDDLSEAERLEYAEVIERQSLYMRELLDDFNLTMRLRNQELPLNLQPTNMEHFVRELVIDLLNDPQFSSKHIQYDNTESAVNWEIDQHLMKRALLNFIYNALLHNEEDVEIDIQVTEEGIIIKDNGKGIAAEEQEQIFERYYRGTNTANIHGTGLGMAISRDIIQAHGGTVQLTSVKGKGTTIKVMLSVSDL